MVKDPITESAKTSSSTAADDTIPVESSPQMDMSSPLRATQHNGLSIHQDRVLTSELQRMHEFNIDRTNTFDPTFYEFSHNLLLYQLTKLENTASLLCPPPVHVHGGFDRQPSSDTLRYHQYDFGSGTPQLHSDEQHLLQAQQEAQQQINTGRNELPHHPYSNYASIRQSQFQIPVGENSIPQTNSTVSLNNLERDNSIPNTTAQASFYQANDTVSFYGDDTSDQIPHSVNESTTTFLNILDPSQSTDAINETIPGEFNVYNEYDVSNASTDSLPNFNRTPARARLYQHPSVNRDLSHLQFFDVVAQRRFQSVNYPPVNQVSHSLEAESYMTPHNLLTLVTQDTNMDHSLTPTFSDVSSFTSSASLHHPTATNSSSLGTFDPSVSIDSVPPAINKTPARTLNSPLASAMVGSSSTTNHRISKKPSLCRLKTTSRKNLNKISGAVASLETNAAITSTRSSPSTASMGLDPTKPDTSILQSQQHLQADTPTSIQSFPYLRSQSQPQPQPQPQLHTLRTFSNASPSSMAVASTGRPSVLATPTSASSGPKGANVFRQDLEATNATSMLSPGVPLLPAADLLQRQDLWKKNYSLGHGREAGRVSVSKRKIQKKKSLKLINDSTADDTVEVLDPKAKSINKRELASLRNNVMGFNPDFNTDNDDVSESDDIDDSFNSKIGKEKLQPSQSKPSKLRKSKSTPLLPSTTRDLLVNKDQPIMKKKYTRRRLLPRSKKGCWICRIKHLKCDEVRPSCGACIRFGLTCDYNPDKPDYVTDKELRQKKLSEISVTRKQNQALEKRPSKRESTKRK